MSTYLIERPDWQLFTAPATLSQKAGVPVDRLRRLVIKEIVDNALDAGADVEIQKIDSNTWEISDDGQGFDPADLSRLFAVDRPLASSKLWRQPTRGAMGNGLRVVAGAVIASRGSLQITTRGGVYDVRPLETGGCDVAPVGATSDGATRVRIEFGEGLPTDPTADKWGRFAILMSGGPEYSGKPSAWHHDNDSLMTLLRGSGARPVREFVTMFDGCTGAKAGEIAQPWIGQRCDSLGYDDAGQLLQRMRDVSIRVSARRLGAVGESVLLGEQYVKVEGEASFGEREDAAACSCVVEVWATRAISGASSVRICVNRTPAAVDARVYRERASKRLVIAGANLGHYIDGPKTGDFHFVLNIIAPFIPIVSDGKSPDLRPFVAPILDAMGKAARKAKGVRSANGEKISQVDILRDNIDDIVSKASGDGAFRPSVRDLFYKARPFYLDAGMEPPEYDYFARMITHHENEVGEIVGLYREERGAITHPHGGGSVALGTQDVETYERPPWLYGAICVIEKGGLIEAVTTAGLHDRLDCAFMTTRGFSTRAAKDLLDGLADHDEPLLVFNVSDADAHGTTIAQTLAEATAARGARKVEIVNLGLFPWEAQQMGLDAEKFTASKSARPVAGFVHDYDDEHGTNWAGWLQSNRYELNAMGLPEFIAWLEKKLIDHGVAKVTPPINVVARKLEADAAEIIRGKILEKILDEAGFEDLVDDAIAKYGFGDKHVDEDELREWLNENPEKNWRGYVNEKAKQTTAAE